MPDKFATVCALFEFLQGTTAPTRIGVVVVVAITAHLLVIGVRRVGDRLLTAPTSLSKARTPVGLLVSASFFGIYFGALGLVLAEFGLSLETYLASASVLGLAIGLGSQGLIQDVMTGVTVVFSGLFDVGEMVELAGQTGLVEHVGMRFTVLRNPLGSYVYIPNRTLANVIRYPRGYVPCCVDVTVPATDSKEEAFRDLLKGLVQGASEQFSGILREPPEIEPALLTSSGRKLVRVTFRIWPGRGGPLESASRSEIVARMGQVFPDYNDWMVAVNHEIATEPASAP